MAAVIKKYEIAKFKARFPQLVEFGLMDDAYAIAVLGADKLGCRPCDVQTVGKNRDGSIDVIRFL